MLKKIIYKGIICTIISLLLCSFTVQNTGIDTPDYDEFNCKIEQLDEDLDKKEGLKDKYDECLDFENELSIEEKDAIEEFVHVEDNSIYLSDEIYQVMPIDDGNLTIEEHKGLYELEYQEDNLIYFKNYKSIRFVKDNISLMNELVEDECGLILDDGTMEFEFNEYSRSSFPGFKSFELGWFKVYFVTDSFGTVAFGGFGVLVNLGNVKDIKNFLNASRDELVDFFGDVFFDFLSEVESYFGNLFLDNLTEIISIMLFANDIISCSSSFLIFVKVATFLLSHCLPGFLKGIVMILSGVFFKLSTKAEVGFWYSSYTILKNNN